MVNVLSTLTYTTHGYRFKNKDERNEFIMKFLASYDLPISLPNPNYKGSLNDKAINAFQASLHFSLFKRWVYQHTQGDEIRENVK